MKFEEKLKNFTPCAEQMPGVVIVHEIREDDLITAYMNKRGLDALGVDLQELIDMKEKFHERFFRDEDLEDIMEKLSCLLLRNDPKETFTVFQEVRFSNRDEWVWHMGSIKIFHQDEHGNPTHLVTVAFPINQMKHIPHKAERLLAENEFFKQNFSKFLSLGSRSKEVLRLVALGKSSGDIARELNISVETVNTHRKNIKRKLNISSTYEFTEYAQAYDLI